MSDYQQLSDFPSTEVVNGSDLIYSENATTDTEQKTTVQQLQYFILSPISGSSATDAGTLTGTETIPLGRTGLFQTTLNKLAAFVLALVCPPVATFAALPAGARGFYFVIADETKGGNPSLYFFTATHRYWVAMAQDA